MATHTKHLNERAAAERDTKEMMLLRYGLLGQLAGPSQNKVSMCVGTSGAAQGQVHQLFGCKLQETSPSTLHLHALLHTSSARMWLSV